ncbi:MAG: hypothetical protein KF884_12285 [Fimbriimonadaceae bacterium]|nr:hypothetical protein [Fimbriimonadaceae bacterium]QYK58321.1 MAG: hypothetical protein KF884_12285 [Fimbriimonadaceae bacterium]
MSPRIFGCFALIVLAGCAQMAADPKYYRRVDFENLTENRPPRGWGVPTPGFEFSLGQGKAPQGQGYARLTMKNAGQAPFGNFMTMIPAKDFAGKRVRLTAWIRSDTPNTYAQMWLRVDRIDGLRGFFDNMQDRPVKHSDGWVEAVIEGPVDTDATFVAIGVMAISAGDVSIDDLRIVILESEN